MSQPETCSKRQAPTTDLHAAPLRSPFLTSPTSFASSISLGGASGHASSHASSTGVSKHSGHISGNTTTYPSRDRLPTREAPPTLSSGSSSHKRGNSTGTSVISSGNRASVDTSKPVQRKQAHDKQVPSSQTYEAQLRSSRPHNPSLTMTAPSTLTRFGAGSALSSSLSLPVIARQHAHADTSVPASSSLSNKRQSVTLLASSIAEHNGDAKRPTGSSSLSVSPVSTSVDEALSSSASSASSSLAYSRDGKGSNISSDSRQSTLSSVGTSVSSGDSSPEPRPELGKNAEQTDEDCAAVANEPLIVSEQPAAPLSNADEQRRTENSEVSNVANGDTAAVDGQQRAGQDEQRSSACLHAERQCSPQHQQVPTIEQRDALAARVYDACRTAGYDEWLQLLDLAPLASQHHLSGYNCIKFGYNGSPYAYLPLSLQQPAQTFDLLERQKVNESSALRWLAQKRLRKRETKLRDDAKKRDTDGDVQMDDERQRKAKKCKCSSPSATPSSVTCKCGPLENETVLASEWEAPFDGQQSVGKQEEQRNGVVNGTSSATDATKLPVSNGNSTDASCSVPVKTSDTHPISISPIIPPELLKDISLHVQRGIPQSINERLSHEENHFDDSVTTDVGHRQHQIDGERLIRCRVTQIDLCEVAFKAEQELIDATQKKRRIRSLKLQAPRASEAPPSIVHDALTTMNTRQSSCPFVVDRSVYCETWYEDEEGDQAGAGNDCSTSPSDPSTSLAIGNLLLSSCPGKKVRLTGPVRGRGAICRDLGLDLARIRAMGVGAVVCCLDDDELQFLGAPWHEYEREADRLDMEVIRLPMAEGFSPTDVVATDKAISCVVNDYTLRGVHVLVHCRGGVGRAGLIACMWMLKLGLVRSDRDEMCFRLPMSSLANLHKDSSHYERGDAGQSADPARNSSGSDAYESHDSAHTHSSGDVMQTVHRLIETIRRRRSPKAIETAEQVSFLVKYLSYLHEQERRHLHRLANTLSQA